MKSGSIISGLLIAFVVISIGYMVFIQTPNPPDEPESGDTAAGTQPSENQAEPVTEPVLPEKADAPGDTVEADRRDTAESAPNRLVVYYFHGNARCWSCMTIERLANEAVNEYFADSLDDGTIEWRVINIDEESNKHYIEDYQLYTRSVIVSDMRDGVELQWKNLDQVWQLLRDEPGFKTYIKDEISPWLEAVAVL